MANVMFNSQQLAEAMWNGLREALLPRSPLSPPSGTNRLVAHPHVLLRRMPSLASEQRGEGRPTSLPTSTGRPMAEQPKEGQAGALKSYPLRTEPMTPRIPLCLCGHRLSEHVSGREWPCRVCMCPAYDSGPVIQ